MRQLCIIFALLFSFTAVAEASVIDNTKLSDEKTFTRYAYPLSKERVYKHPKQGAKQVARLHWSTELNSPEIYLTLREKTMSNGNVWVRIRLPQRPNGTIGWVRREALSNYHRVTTHLVIKRKQLKAVLFKNGRKVWKSKIGVGATSTPTPRGDFYLREKLELAGGIYGARAFGTSAYSSLSDWPKGGVIGIHGTDQPELLPGRVSHGCIRVPNQEIKRLARKIKLGTPVTIH